MFFSDTVLPPAYLVVVPSPYFFPNAKQQYTQKRKITSRLIPLTKHTTDGSGSHFGSSLEKKPYIPANPGIKQKNKAMNTQNEKGRLKIFPIH